MKRTFPWSAAAIGGRRFVLPYPSLSTSILGHAATLDWLSLSLKATNRSGPSPHARPASSKSSWWTGAGKGTPSKNLWSNKRRNGTSPAASAGRGSCRNRSALRISSAGACNLSCRKQSVWCTYKRIRFWFPCSCRCVCFFADSHTVVWSTTPLKILAMTTLMRFQVLSGWISHKKFWHPYSWSGLKLIEKGELNCNVYHIHYFQNLIEDNVVWAVLCLFLPPECVWMAPPEAYG